VTGTESGSGMAGTHLARGGRPEQPERVRERVRVRQPGRWRRAAARAVFLVPGAVLLVVDGYDLGRLSLWRDEAYTVDAAHRSLPQIFALLRNTDAVNSAYYMIIHADIALFGTSAAALRLPSLLAMAVAAVAVAAIGSRLARAASLPAPALTGVLAGLLFAVAPEVTRYAQEARSYGLVTMCATIASYLLLRALGDGRRRWWVAYGVAIAVAGLLNLMAFLLVAAHGVTVWVARARQRSMPHSPGLVRPVPVAGWLAAAGAAAAVLCPLLVLGFGERRQVGWLARPGLHAVTHLAAAFAGAKPLVPLVALLAAGGLAAGLTGRPRVPLDAATLTLPWLVLPAGILLAVSQIHPLYDARYIVFSLPALALLGATGLAWLTRLVTRAAPGVNAAVAWLPAALVLVLLAALTLGPQRSVRLPSSRPDNLRQASAIVAAHERPGDAVLYLPANKRVFSMGYPAPFRRLRDVALGVTPLAAASLIGTAAPVPVLRARFATVNRVWVVSGRGKKVFTHPSSHLEKAEVALLRPFRLIGRWHVGQGMLSLFARAPRPAAPRPAAQ
jgi:mannosyltransferase